MWPNLPFTTPSPITPPKLTVSPGALFGGNTVNPMSLQASTLELTMINPSAIQTHMDEAQIYGSLSPTSPADLKVPSGQILASVSEMLNGATGFRSVLIDVLAENPTYSRDLLRHSIEDARRQLEELNGLVN